MKIGCGAMQQNRTDSGPGVAAPAFLFVGEGETALSLRVFQAVETAANKAQILRGWTGFGGGILYPRGKPVQAHQYGATDNRDEGYYICLLYTSPSPRDGLLSRMPSSA